MAFQSEAASSTIAQPPVLPPVPQRTLCLHWFLELHHLPLLAKHVRHAGLVGLQVHTHTFTWHSYICVTSLKGHLNFERTLAQRCTKGGPMICVISPAFTGPSPVEWVSQREGILLSTWINKKLACVAAHLVKGHVGEGVEETALEVWNHRWGVRSQGQDLQESGITDKVEPARHRYCFR